jgi:succinate-acetate transporter protein
LSNHLSDNKQWILGNTFPFVVFASFGAFWLGFAATLQPIYNAYGAYADPSVQGSTGLESVGFNVGIGKSFLPTIWVAFAY